MNNLEALKANIADAHGLVLTNNHWIKALIDEGLTSTDNYTSSTSIDKATLRIYDMILGTGTFSEGDISYNVNLDEVRKAKEQLQDKLGIRVKGRNVNVARPW